MAQWRKKIPVKYIINVRMPSLEREGKIVYLSSEFLGRRFLDGSGKIKIKMRA